MEKEFEKECIDVQLNHSAAHLEMYNLTRYEEASDKPKLGNILLNMALLAESEEELKGLLMKEESEKVG